MDTNIPVGVSALSSTPLTLDGTLANISGRGLKLLTDTPLGVGMPVRLETKQFLLLGEVCYCQKQGARWMVGVQLEHALTNLEQLVQLNQRLFAEDAGRTEAEEIAASRSS